MAKRSRWLFLVSFALLNIAGQPLLAERSAPPTGDRAPKVVDATAMYSRMVVPQVTADEWLDAWRELGLPADRRADADRVIGLYGDQFKAICDDIANYCSERELRDCLTGQRAEDPGAETAIRECFARLRNRAWPQADSLIETTWSALTVDIAPDDPARVEVARRAKAALLRRAFARDSSSPTSWAYGGEGLDLRVVMRGAAQDPKLDERLRQALKFASEPSVVDASEMSQEARRAGEGARAALVSLEEFQSTAVLAYFRTYRELAVTRPEPGADPRAAAESRHAKRARAAQEMRSRVHAAVSEVNECLARELGEVAAAEWDEASMAAALPEAFQEEQPTVVLRWLRSHDLLSDERKKIYVDYVQARTSLRKQVAELVLRAKQESPAPPRAGDAMSERIGGLTKQRRELSETAVQQMIEGLDPNERQTVGSLLDALRRQWDPARPWRNV